MMRRVDLPLHAGIMQNVRLSSIDRPMGPSDRCCVHVRSCGAECYSRLTVGMRKVV